MSATTAQGILKVTSVTGAASAATILIGIIRTKTVAVVVGPEGIGLMGIFQSVIALSNSVAGTGLNSVGVRLISSAKGSGNEQQVEWAARSLLLAVGIAGPIVALVVLVGASGISHVTFGNLVQTPSVQMLSLAVLFGTLTVGYSSILQGLRRQAQLAYATVAAAFIGTCLTIPCYFRWGSNAIVPSLIILAAVNLVFAYWFATRERIHFPAISIGERLEPAWNVLTKGAPFMLTALVSTGTSYAITSLVARNLGVNTVGAWQAAMTLSGVMTSFVLSSMATDYFPRLSAIATDPEKVKEEVNAQTEVSLLLATPVLVGTYALASPIILLFYSPEFDAAVDLLRIAALGVYLRVISYPLGYVVLAKGRGALFLGIELGHNLFYLAMALAGIRAAGIEGVAWAFLALNALTIAVNNAAARRLCRFRWSRENIRHLLVTSLLMLVIAVVSLLEIGWPKIVLVVLTIAGSGVYSYLLLKQKY